MAWRPYANLIDGELDNRTPGKVTGWMRFYRTGMEPLRISLELRGDFHEDIYGRRIRLNNPQPTDENIALDRKGTYMQGFVPIQHGVAGDITAGLRNRMEDSANTCTGYPYIEWFSDANGRVVLELDPLQMESLDEEGRPMPRGSGGEPHPVKREKAMIDELARLLDAESPDGSKGHQDRTPPE